MDNDLISRSALLAVPNVRKVTEYDEAGYSISYNAVPVKVIENAPSVDVVPKDFHERCMDNWVNELLAALDATPKWISVQDRLPEEDDKYIVCTAKGSVYSTRFRTHSRGGDFMTDTNTHITHWMPLPDPPKEE